MSVSVVKCSLVKCSEVLQCNDGTSNKVSNIIIKHTSTDNRKLLLICILLLSHSVIFFRFLFFVKYGCILCIFIGRGYLFLLLSMYSYC